MGETLGLVLSDGDSQTARPRIGAVDLGEGRITANHAIFHGSWDSLWAGRVAERVAKHRRIASEGGASTLRRWHRQRADGLERSRAERVSACGTRTIALRCGCDEYTRVRARCGTRLVCPTCARAYAGTMARRVRLSVEAHLEEQTAQWRSRGALPGAEPSVYMVTLTVPHEDEPGAAERLLDRAWRQLRRHAGRGHWSRSCLAVREWTPGRDGRGHPHMHVIVVARWLDYGHVRATWRRAALEVGAGEPRGRGGVDITRNSGGRKKAAKNAANYVAKYLTAAPDLNSVSDWARLAAWMAGRRLVLASRGWWRAAPPHCPCCEQRYLFCSRVDGAWLAVGGSENPWAHRSVVEYDPLSGWCRMRFDAENPGLEPTHDYGSVSIADSDERAMRLAERVRDGPTWGL